MKREGSFKYHFFAVNDELYLISDPSDPFSANEHVEFVIHDIGEWLITNLFSKNMIVRHHFSVQKLPTIRPPLRVGCDFITPSEVGRNLSVVFHSTMLNMNKQIMQLYCEEFVCITQRYVQSQMLPHCRSIWNHDACIHFQMARFM